MEMMNRSGVVVKSAHARFLGGCGSLHTRTRRTTGEQRRLVETVKHRAPEPAFSVLLTEVIWLTNHPGSWRSATVTVLTFSPFVFVPVEVTVRVLPSLEIMRDLDGPA